jgi:CheY-like chemotaxis protein
VDPGSALASLSLQGLVYTFESLAELGAALESSRDDHDLELPCRRGVTDGEWVLVTFAVESEAEATTLPGRVRDRGNDLRLTFEERDWERLQRFADGGGRPSLPPASVLPLSAVDAPAGSRALVVDHDPNVLSIVRAMLEACGVVTETVHGAEEALDVLRRHCFDLVVVEPALDGMSGLELCRRLRGDAALAQVPILVLTSHTTESELRATLGSGADDFVGKPFRAHELRARAIGLIQQGRAAAPSVRRA